MTTRNWKHDKIHSCIPFIGVLLVSASNFQNGESSSVLSCNELLQTSCIDSISKSSVLGIFTAKFEKHEERRNGRSLHLEKPPSATKLFDNLFSRRVFNTTMNFIVPGAKVNLPHNSKEGSLIHLAMQAFFGQFWAVAWISTIAVPAALTYFKPLGIGRSFDTQNDFHLKWKLNEKLAEGIGLNWTRCMQKTICQAHDKSSNRNYGALGKIVQLLFPVSANTSALPISSVPFHESAEHGAIGHNCNRIYRCFFDVLDVIYYVKNHCFAVFPP